MEEYSIASLLNVSQNEEQEGENHEKLDEFICAHGEMLSDEEGSLNHSPLSTPTKSGADAHRYSPSSPLSCGPMSQPQDPYPVSHSCLTLPSDLSGTHQSDLYIQPRQLNLSPTGLEHLDRHGAQQPTMVSGEGDLAELQHLRVLCRAQGDRIEQMGKMTAARDEENERNMRIIRHEKTVAMEELDKMAKLYRELEASKEGLGREMAALREQVGEERGRVQTLEDSRKELVSQLEAAEAAKESLTAQVRELSSSDLLSRVRDGYTSAQTQSKELHEQQVATLKEELDVVRHDSEAKTEAIQQLQSEIQDLHARLSDGGRGRHNSSPKSLHLDGEEEDLQTRLIQYSAHAEDLQYQLTASLEQLEGVELRAISAEEALQAQSSELGAVKDERQYLRDQLNLFQQQLAQLKQDADLDKKACLDKCRQTLLQLHEDATNRIRQSQLTELERVQGEHQAQVSRLLGDLTAVKEEYTLLCKEKNQLAVELEQLKARQLGTVTSKERDEAVARAKAEWREQMMRENAAMVEKALQESQRSWELRLEREKAQAVYVARQDLEKKIDEAKRELEGLRQSVQVEKEVAGREAVRLARLQWMREGDEGLQARTDAAVSVAHKLWREQEGKARVEAVEAAVASVGKEWEQKMRKAVQETAERVKQECRREHMGEVEAAVAREREAAVAKEREVAVAREREAATSKRVSSVRKQSGEEEVKRQIQQAKMQWEAEQTVVLEGEVAKASRATREHYEGLLRECEGRWRQELAKRSRESHKAVCDFGCQTQLAAGDSLQRKIQEQIETTRQALKRDVAQLLAERDSVHQAELAHVRLTVTREVEGAYLRCLEKVVDHDSPSREGGVASTKMSDSSAKKPTTSVGMKKPPRRASGERYQQANQPRKTTK